MTESFVNQILPVKGTLSKLNIGLSDAAGSGKTYTFTVMKNGLATSVSCSISETVAVSCGDSENSAIFSADDTISIRSVPSGTPSSHYMRWTAKFQ